MTKPNAHVEALLRKAAFEATEHKYDLAPDDVERVARVIDPKIWEVHDDIANRRDDPGDAEWHQKWCADSKRDGGRWWQSLETARAAIAAMQPQDDGDEKRIISLRNIALFYVDDERDNAFECALDAAYNAGRSSAHIDRQQDAVVGQIAEFVVKKAHALGPDVWLWSRGLADEIHSRMWEKP